MVLDTLTTGDRVNLLELYARSAMLLDLGKCEEWTDLFESRAVVRCSGRVGATMQAEFAGREELLQLARETGNGTFNLALVRVNPPVLCRHILSNICLFAEGNRNARGCAHLMVTTRGELEPPRWVATGVYFDRLCKCASGCWKFESRVFIPDMRPRGELAAAGL